MLDFYGPSTFFSYRELSSFLRSRRDFIIVLDRDGLKIKYKDICTFIIYEPLGIDRISTKDRFEDIYETFIGPGGKSIELLYRRVSSFIKREGPFWLDYMKVQLIKVKDRLKIVYDLYAKDFKVSCSNEVKEMLLNHFVKIDKPDFSLYSFSPTPYNVFWYEFLPTFSDFMEDVLVTLEGLYRYRGRFSIVWSWIFKEMLNLLFSFQADYPHTKDILKYFIELDGKLLGKYMRHVMVDKTYSSMKDLVMFPFAVEYLPVESFVIPVRRIYGKYVILLSKLNLREIMNGNVLINDSKMYLLVEDGDYLTIYEIDALLYYVALVAFHKEDLLEMVLEVLDSLSYLGLIKKYYIPYVWIDKIVGKLDVGPFVFSTDEKLSYSVKIDCVKDIKQLIDPVVLGGIYEKMMDHFYIVSGKEDYYTALRREGYLKTIGTISVC